MKALYLQNTNPKNDDALGAKALTGAALMIATRVSVRLLGLVSVTILARILTPDDFGLFGSAAIILAFFVLFREIGFGEALIKNKNVDKADVDTFWTIRFCLCLLIAAGVVATAPMVTVFLKDPRIEGVLYYMALIPVIESFYSPATAFLLRELKYGSDFLLKSADKLIRVIAVILIALSLRSYWALVYGALIASTLSVIASHIVRPYRPKITLSRLNVHASFVSWAYLRSISHYFASSSDELLVRGIYNTAFFGIYHIARDLGRVLIAEAISPIREAMLPALARLQDDRARYAEAVSNILGATIIIATAVSVGVLLIADELVLVLLGSQWAQASHFLAYVAIGCACNSIGDVNQSSYVAIGRQAISSRFWLARALLYAAGCFIAATHYGAQAVAVTFSALSFLAMLVESTSMLKTLGARSTFLSLFIRPTLAAVAMTLAVTNVPDTLGIPLAVLLVTKAGVGALTYCLTLLLLWKLSGLEKGPETALIENLPPKVRKFIPFVAVN
jgi:lipopolysaccharide exporter